MISPSPELKALAEEYRKLREHRPVQTGEPQNTGRTVSAFVDLSTKVAEEYTPSKYLKSAPIK